MKTVPKKPVSVSCPCGARLQIRFAVGKKIRCPRCTQVFAAEPRPVFECFCGYKIEHEKHQTTIKCPKCGATTEIEDRPSDDPLLELQQAPKPETPRPALPPIHRPKTRPPIQTRAPSTGVFDWLPLIMATVAMPIAAYFLGAAIMVLTIVSGIPASLHSFGRDLANYIGHLTLILSGAALLSLILYILRNGIGRYILMILFAIFFLFTGWSVLTTANPIMMALCAFNGLFFIVLKSAKGEDYLGGNLPGVASLVCLIIGSGLSTLIVGASIVLAAAAKNHLPGGTRTGTNPMQIHHQLSDLQNPSHVTEGADLSKRCAVLDERKSAALAHKPGLAAPGLLPICFRAASGAGEPGRGDKVRVPAKNYERSKHHWLTRR